MIKENAYRALSLDWAALETAASAHLPRLPRAWLAGPLRAPMLFAELEEDRLAWDELRHARGIDADAGRLITSQWTLRDLLSHVCSWTSEFCFQAEAVASGRRLDYEIVFHPGIGPTEWNHARVTERRGQSLQQIFEEIDSDTRRLEELVLSIPATRLNARTDFACVIGPERRPLIRSLADLVLARCFHDRHHLSRIGVWRAAESHHR